MRALLIETVQRLGQLRTAPVSPEMVEELMSIEFHGARLARRLRALGEEGILNFSVRTPKTIRELVDSAVREVEEDCGRRGIVMAVEVEPDLPDMWLDGEQLIEAMRCILDNAIEALGRGGRIVVRAVARPGCVELAIGNDGPPIAGDILAHAFDAGVSSRRTGPGEGLGLTIVRAVADAVGGNVRIASAADWTEVALSFPRARDVNADSRAARRGHNWVFPLPTAA